MDDQKELVKNYKDAVERLTGEKEELKTALDEAEAALVGDENNQQKIDTKNAA